MIHVYLLQSVYKARIINCLDELSHWNIERLTAAEIHETVQALKSYITQVHDDNHIVQCCASACLPTFQDTLEVLQLTKSRVSSES